MFGRSTLTGSNRPGSAAARGRSTGALLVGVALRVLFLTCHLPYPPISGGRRREMELLERLPSVDVDLLVVTKTPEEDRANTSALRRICRSVSVFDAAPDRAPAGLAPQIARHWCPEVAEKVRSLLSSGDIDLVHIEGFYLTHLLPEACPVPVLLVEQNIEFELFAQRAGLSDDPVERLSLLREYRATRAAEVAAWHSADSIAVLTERDRVAVRREAPGTPVALVPDGVDFRASDAARNFGEHQAVVFVGNYAYGPNADAATWLCEELAPVLKQEVPLARLLLVGNEPTEEMRRCAEASDGRVIVTGRVSDTGPYLECADVVVCPLRFGGGVKVKMLEALSAGRAIVTTPVGSQGLEALDRSFLVREPSAEFSDAVVGLLRDPHRRRGLERAATEAVGQLPTWDDAAGALVRCYSALLERPAAAVPFPA